MSTIRKHWGRLALALTLTLMLATMLAAPAAAVEFRSGDTVVIGKDEVIDDDLFITATTVKVYGTVNGNLFAAGSQVEVDGTVNGSLFTAGQSLALNGKVDGSLYGGGTSLVLGPQSSVRRNVFFYGFGLRTESGSKVGRDLLVGGYQAQLNGEVSRDFKFNGGALELNGKVGRNVSAQVGEPQAGGQPPMFFMPMGMPASIRPGLRVGKEASIGGKLAYTSAVEQGAAIQVTPVGGVAYQIPTPEPGKIAAGQAQGSTVIRLGYWALDRAREFITLLVLGALALWVMPSLLNAVVDKAQARALPAAGWGLIVVIVGYLGAVVLALLIFAMGILFGVLTLGGLMGTVLGVGFSGLGLAFTVFTLLVSYGSKLVVAYLFGRLLLQTLAKQYADRKFLTLVVGVVVYALVAWIPILGWLIGLVATLIGLGAMWLWFRERRAVAAPAPIWPGGASGTALPS
jgi:cytoskeletal protein CcmA (bactofilin family)